MGKHAVSESSKEPATLRPTTQLLTEGFDPSLSVGSARPAVFRSSTYVFSSPEAAERAFDLSSGRAQVAKGESPDLIYSRFNHPNAQMLEDQIVYLEKGSASALAFNCGMAAIVNIPVQLPPSGPIRRIYDTDLRRNAAFHPGLSLGVGRGGDSCVVGARRSAHQRHCFGGEPEALFCSRPPRIRRW